MKTIIEDVFRLIKDQESFYPVYDELSDMLWEEDNGELSGSDLTFVAAAAKPMSYQDFLRRYGK